VARHATGGAGFFQLSLDRPFGHFQSLVLLLDGFVAADTGFMIGLLEIGDLIALFGRCHLIMATGGHAAHVIVPILPGMMAILTIDGEMSGMGKFNGRPFCLNIPGLMKLEMYILTHGLILSLIKTGPLIMLYPIVSLSNSRWCRNIFLRYRNY
jgi:hypothetical protein